MLRALAADTHDMLRPAPVLTDACTAVLIEPSACTPAVETSAANRVHLIGRGSSSGRQLGVAVLAYLAAVTLLITWAPFDFATRPQHGFTRLWSISDLVLNVVMFLPLGFFWQSSRAHEAMPRWWMVGVYGVLFSTAIECGQLLLADRFSSMYDIATNGLGAAIGARVFSLVRPRLRVGANTVSLFALDLPLTGLAMLLIPLLWTSGFASAGTARVWLMLPVAAFGGAILGAVHGAYLAISGRVRRAYMLAAVACWFLAAALPGASGNAELLLAGTTVAVGAAWLRSYASARARERHGVQRVELPTLRLALPLFAAYLVLSSLWPLDAVDGTWRSAWVLAPARSDLSRALLMQCLEYLAAFTVVGYVSAELHGRANAAYVTVWRRVAAIALALVLMLEFARGWNTTMGASVSLGAMALGAAVFGGWLYHLQRDHVRTLLRRGSHAE